MQNNILNPIKQAREILKISEIKITSVLLLATVVAFSDFIIVAFVYWLTSIAIDKNQTNVLSLFTENESFQIAIGASIVAVAYLAKNLLSVYINMYLLSKIWSWFHSIGTRIFDIFLFAPYHNILAMNSSAIRTTLTSVEMLTQQFCMTIRAISDIVSGILLGVFLVSIDPLLGLVLLVSMIIVFFILIMPLHGQMSKLGQQCMIAEQAMTKSSVESHAALKEARVFGYHRYLRSSISDTIGKFASSQGKREGLLEIPRAVNETILFIFIAIGAIVLAFSGRDIMEAIPFGGALLASAIRLLPSFNRITGCLSMWSNVAPYSNAIFEKFTKEDLKPEISKEMEYSVKPFKSVDLNNLSFQYPGFKHNALSNFCLTIKAGECIGIAGESGSGKTTLSNMILGLLKPHSGEIIVDGIPINENIQDWRKQCALVSQNPFFTDDTIAKNIALGVAESGIDNNLLEKSLRLANLQEYIKNLKNGLGTRVGENGSLISGGQKQRIAIARAIYFRRNFVVLDEATSSLDTTTEKEIIRSIKMLKGKMTFIIIAHRLDTLRICDKILVMKKGAIVQEGSFADLEKNDGAFKKMIVNSKNI